MHLIFNAVILAYVLYGAAFYRPFIPDIRAHIAVWSFFLMVNIVPAYLNIYLLMPKYLYTHRYTAYAVCLFGLIASVAFFTAMAAHF